MRAERSVGYHTGCLCPGSTAGLRGLCEERAGLPQAGHGRFRPVPQPGLLSPSAPRAALQGDVFNKGGNAARPRGALAPFSSFSPLLPPCFALQAGDITLCATFCPPFPVRQALLAVTKERTHFHCAMRTEVQTGNTWIYQFCIRNI